MLTGLRKGELASLTTGQLDLDAPVAYAVLNAADEKSGRGAEIPLRPDLADDMKRWIALRLNEAQQQARIAGQPVPSRLRRLRRRCSTCRTA